MISTILNKTNVQEIPLGAMVYRNAYAKQNFEIQVAPPVEVEVVPPGVKAEK